MPPLADTMGKLRSSEGGNGRGDAMRKSAGLPEVSPGQVERAELVFANILTIQRAMQSGMQAIDEGFGLSGSQLSALWHVSATPGIRVTVLAAALYVQHSTASNLLDKLERRGLIRRERSAQDKRTVGVFLTDQGRKLVRKLPGPMHGRLRTALRELPEEVLDGLGEGIAALLASLPLKNRRIVG